MTRRKKVLLGALLVMLALFGLDQSRAVRAIEFTQAIIVTHAPVLTDPDRQTTIAGSANPVLGIDDPSSTAEEQAQRLIITNLDAVNDLCVFWLATGGDCTVSSIDCDMTVEAKVSGDLILPNSSKTVTVGGDLRTCLVASASPTMAHISRAKVE